MPGAGRPGACPLSPRTQPKRESLSQRLIEESQNRIDRQVIQILLSKMINLVQEIEDFELIHVLAHLFAHM